MYIKGFGLGGFRSFRNPQLFWPLGKVNLFVGQNNSGKSNVLHFITRFLRSTIKASTGESSRWEMDDYLDVPQGMGRRELTLLLARSISIKENEQLADRLQDVALNAIAEKVFNSPALTRGTPVAWFEYFGAPSTKFELRAALLDELANDKRISDGEWQRLWTKLTSQNGGGRRQHWVPQSLAALSPVREAYPEALFIPAIRLIGDGANEQGHWSGRGLVVQLAQVQNPLPRDHRNRERFNQLNNLLREVTGNEDANLEIPHDRSGINVHMDGKVLPLSSLGTGIQEVIILGAAATVHSDMLICMEEPEIHLHPSLQRKLLRYLQENTTNQYFIATHSAHLIDIPNASVFRVRLDNGATVVSNASTPNDKWEICTDLGYRPSDLMQANCVVWVEGPTDRLYVRNWLASLAPDLLEGVHYSIMFYGGRLLSHLSASDEEVSEFISLRRLNRRSAIVMDSDKANEDDEINATKRRVQKEFDQAPGLAWITAGKEMENYFTVETMLAGLQQIDPKATGLQSKSPFKTAWKYKHADGTPKEADKIKLAHALTGKPPHFDVLDLRQQLERLLGFIREANGPTIPRESLRVGQSKSSE